MEKKKETIEMGEDMAKHVRSSARWAVVQSVAVPLSAIAAAAFWNAGNEIGAAVSGLAAVAIGGLAMRNIGKVHDHMWSVEKIDDMMTQKS